MPDEKKPPEGAVKENFMAKNTIGLNGIGLLILEAMPDGGVIVHSLGAEYSESPSCRQAVEAALAWAAGIDRTKTAVGTSLDPAEFDDAGAHLNAFIDEIGAGFFWHRQMPPVVVVPGLGRWIYMSDSTAERLSPQDRANLMVREEFGRPSKTLLHPSRYFEDRQL